jgi:hypothetical protein
MPGPLTSAPLAPRIGARVNDQFRICFTWRDGNAYEVDIVDYPAARKAPPFMGAMDSAEAAGVQCRLVRCLLLFNILAHDADRRTAARCSEIAG